MAEYYIPFSMKRNDNEAVTFRLKITEKPNIKNNISSVTTDVQYKNTSGKTITGYDFEPKIVVNGTTIFDEKIYDKNLFANNDFSTLYSQSTNVSHDANGNGSLSVSAEIKADYIILTGIPLTKGSASFSGQLTPIDITDPVIKELTISADRYGLNAGISFTAVHASYAISDIVFKLYGLSQAQAQSRAGKATQADWSTVYHENGAYSLELRKWNNLSDDNTIFFDLDSANETENPLDSGGSYLFELIITAQNGKIAKREGYLNVPQKVLGVTCEAHLELNPNQTVDLDYTVIPENAEEPGVIFESSDSNVAQINANGVITAVSEGPCLITVTSVDGNFVAACTVNVIDTSVFPLLSPVTDYLTASYFNKIVFAANFIKNELDERGISVPDLNIITFSGRNEPVVNIRSLLQSMETNCQTLKSSAQAAGILTVSLAEHHVFEKQNTGWIIFINNWISFLNELHSKLNGG